MIVAQIREGGASPLGFEDLDAAWDRDFDRFPQPVREFPRPEPLADDPSREVEREELREALGRDSYAPD